MIPGSALRKLTAITGLQATMDAPSCFRLQIAESVAFFSFVKDEKEACEELRKMNWARVSRNVFEAQAWKCFECKQRLPLSAHHVIFKSRWRRSMGPLDVESNLRGLCAQHHEEEHR